MSKPMVPRRGIIAAGLGGAGLAGLSALRGSSEVLATTGGMRNVEVLMPTGDTSGYTDTCNLYHLLSGNPGLVVKTPLNVSPGPPPNIDPAPFTAVVLGPGQFYLGYGYGKTSVSIPLTAGNQAIVGMGTAVTYCCVGTSFPSVAAANTPGPLNSPFSGVFAISGSEATTGDFTISGIRFCGELSTTASNPATSAITIEAASRVVLEDLAFEYINGWMIDYRNPSTSGPVSLALRGIRGWFCAGGIKINGNGNSVGASLSDCETAQLGVSEGPFKNLDALFLLDAHDLMGTNLGFSAGYQQNSSAAKPYGHGFHLVGDVSDVCFDVINSTAFYYPLPGNGQCGLLIEDGPRGSRASHVTFSHAVFKTWDIGFNFAGTGYDITLDHCVVGSNQTHGGVIGRAGSVMGGGVLIDSCRFGSNGMFNLNQTDSKPPPSPVNTTTQQPVYDLNILATSAHTPDGNPSSGHGWGGTVRFCRFNSTISSTADTPAAVQSSVFVDPNARGLFRFEFNEFASTVGNFSHGTGPSLVVRSPS